MTGLSRAWGDIYRATRVGQYVDVTGLAAGRYRLHAKADSGGWFKEKKEKNNFTWVDIQISGDSVSVIRYESAAQPIRAEATRHSPRGFRERPFRRYLVP